MTTTMYRGAALILFTLLCGCGSAPSRQSSQLVQLARQADQNYQSGKFAQAKSQYETILAANPKFVPGQIRLGVIAYHDGDAKTARSRFETALQLDPRNAQARYNLAMLHLNEVTMLLDGYLDASPPAANRQQVTALLGYLREFGSRQEGK
ncbi:tetratricopeptide repeat protein [Povalibacter sp.]|uniref:tetratricopeptide repeat protein n=1 Tax=Povalibacter sp. TaxID=1962978 RepID=UPI002F3F10FC